MLLMAHGLVHLLYLAPDVSEFSLERSWLLSDPARKPVAYFLIASTVIAFILLALAVWQAPRIDSAWPVLALVGAGLSTAVLVLFWNRALVLGLVINALLIAAAILRPAWLERFMSGG
ncbi:hypothetical protein [Humibacillus xanthopallidus]|uniref:hypothetical protein n=1 Tax=Humibacillus xanthopallidus TaxID=412689 RepID=UPI001C8AB279|nr:hypothetical protein [Humibacillus xanthopallidus]